MLAPLGCGVQTGMGAFINIADVQSHHDVAVIGVGSVGQSAVIAAAMRGCKTIIAIDRDRSRLRVAKGFGATHTILNRDGSIDLVAEVRTITEGRGCKHWLDSLGISYGTMAR